MPVDPADQVAIGNVADEEVQRVGGLVETAVAQVVAGHWTMSQMVWFGAGAAELVVPAAVEMPVALQLRAGGAATEHGLDIMPLRAAVSLHVVVGHAIRDALIAQRRHQPIKQRRGVEAPDGGGNAFGPQLRANIVDQAGRSGQAADTVYHPNSVIEHSGIWWWPRVSDGSFN